MKLSPVARRIASYLVDAPYTLHDLVAILIKLDGVPSDEAPALLRDALRELATQSLIEWSFEPDWGNAPSIRPTQFGPDTFMEDWNRCTAKQSLVPGVPDADHPTLFVDRSSNLRFLWRRKGGESVGA